MAPHTFWALTIPEILSVLGPARRAATPRDALARLMEAFPDDR